MEHLTRAQVDELRRQIEGERDGLLARARAVRQGEADVDPDTGDRQDAAATEAARAMELRLARHELARLRALDAALTRMSEGTYGICEDTGEPIPAGRLRIEPTTRVTVEAGALREDEARGPVRRGGGGADPY